MMDAAWCLRELRAYAAQNPGTPLETIAATLGAEIETQAETIRVLEAQLYKSRQDHAQDVRCMSERIGGRLESVRDAAVAAVRCADTCEGPHPVSQAEITTTWDRLRAALSKAEV